MILVSIGKDAQAETSQKLKLKHQSTLFQVLTAAKRILLIVENHTESLVVKEICEWTWLSENQLSTLKNTVVARTSQLLR